MSQDIFDREALRQQPHYGGTSKPGSNGSGKDRSQNPPQPPVSPVLLAGSVGSIIVLSIVLVVSLLFSGGSPQAAPDAVQAPTVHAPTVPPPVSTLVPTATAGETAIALVDQLIAERQYATAAYMAEKALKPTRSDLSERERAALQERALTAKLYALAEQDPAYLDVPVQQQQVKQYLYLKEKARAAGIPFLSPLEVAQLAKDNSHWRWAKFAYEEAYKEGAWSQADDLIMRQYEEVIYRQGWWLAQASGASGCSKDEGPRLLALRYAFDKAHGRAKDHAWVALRHHCGTDETKWPLPAETPLLPAAQKGGRQ
jgi:hypothetical protein